MGVDVDRDFDEDVVLHLTARQASVLDYVVRRAQEDPDFFGAVSSGDHRVATTFRITLSQLVVKLKAVVR